MTADVFETLVVHGQRRHLALGTAQDDFHALRPGRLRSKRVGLRRLGLRDTQKLGQLCVRPASRRAIILKVHVEILPPIQFRRFVAMPASLSAYPTHTHLLVGQYVESRQIVNNEQDTLIRIGNSRKRRTQALCTQLNRKYPMTNRIDALRGNLSYQKIAELINDSDGINTNASTISKLAKGQMQLTETWLSRLSRALGVDRAALLGDEPHATSGQLQEDAALYEPDDGSPLAGLRQKNRDLWEVRSSALDELGIVPGALILVDVSEAAVASVQTGDPVVVQVYSDAELTSAVTLLRQFIEPNLLITNSRDDNELPLNMQTANAHIKGRILHHIRQPGS